MTTAQPGITLLCLLTDRWRATEEDRIAWLCSQSDCSAPKVGANPSNEGRSGGLLGRDLLADLLERAADQPRHVHLRDADLLGDLRLRQPLEEAQVENPPLALVEDTETGLEHGPILGDLVLVLLGAERLERVELTVVV